MFGCKKKKEIDYKIIKSSKRPVLNYAHGYIYLNRDLESLLSSVDLLDDVDKLIQILRESSTFRSCEQYYKQKKIADLESQIKDLRKGDNTL